MNKRSLGQDDMANSLPPSRLEGALNIVTEVRRGEGLIALLLTVQIFFTLTAYSIIKPVREALILADPDGAAHKSYATGAIALLMLIAVPLYAMVANRMARHRLVIGVIGFFVMCLVVFYGLSTQVAIRPYLGIPFYLWVGLFNMMAVAQFWSFANDVYTEEQGMRLFALVGIGQSLGAALGSKLTSWLLQSSNGTLLPTLSIYDLLLVSAACLSLTAVIALAIHRLQPSKSSPSSTQNIPQKVHPVQPKARPPKGGFGLVWASHYLILLAAFHFLFTLVNTNGEYILSAAVSDLAPLGPERSAWIGAFYGDFYFGVNALGVLLQVLVVSRIVKHGGLRIAFLVLPVIVVFGAALVAIFPLLGVLRVSKTIENATDYSLNNTVRQMLWLPTGTEVQYKAKQAVDTFFVRMGDAASAVVVFAALSWFSLGLQGFAVLNVVLGLCWLVLGGAIITAYSKKTSVMKTIDAS